MRLGGDLISRDDVEKEVELFVVRNDSSNIVTLKSFSVVFARVVSSLMSDLSDEHLTRQSENNRRLTRYHAHVLVGLHDFLDASQGQNLRLQFVQVVRLSLDFVVQVLKLFVKFVYVLGVIWVLYTKNTVNKHVLAVIWGRITFIHDLTVT